MTTLRDLFDELSKIKKKAQEEGQELMKQEFRNLFSLFPYVKAVRFQTWIPSFNDGDPCEFTLGDLFVNLGDVRSEDDEDFSGDPEDDGWLTSFELGWVHPSTGEAKDEELAGYLQGLDVAFQQNKEIIEYIVEANSDVIIIHTEIRINEYYCGY